LNEIAECVVAMDVPGTAERTRAVIDANVPPEEILDHGLVAGLQIVGERFEAGEAFLPELLMSGEAMKGAMELLRPLLARNPGGGFKGRAAIGTVQGDVHDIGKNILVMMLEGNGWEVTDLGVDVAPEAFCSAVEANEFQILGLSALLTTTMPNQQRTIEALEAAGVRQKVKVAVGGSVVTQEFADRIGADCFASDAVEAVRKFAQLVQ
jgi:5-methyltetrahydrofolate--homocysteine methyltransferase